LRSRLETSLTAYVDEGIALEPTTKKNADFMNSDNRIAARYVFESRILIRFCRGSQKFAAQGWARDLSESGLGAFVAENLVIGKLVTLQISLGISGKDTERRTTARDSSSVERTDSNSILARKQLII